MLPGPTPSFGPRTEPCASLGPRQAGYDATPNGPCPPEPGRQARSARRATYVRSTSGHVNNSTAACRPFPSTSGQQKDRYGWPHRMRANAWKSLRTAGRRALSPASVSHSA